MHQLVLAQKTSSLEKSLIFALAVGLFALSGLASIPLPLWLSPVPLVLQVNIAVLYGAIFGSKKSLQILLTCYALAICNIPMFSNGSTGIAKFFGPTGGYLFGYIVAAYVMGKIVESKKIKNPMNFFVYFNLANLCVYAFGLPVLSLFVGPKMVFIAGFFPFMPGMLIKNLIITKVFFSFMKEKDHQI